ncbi:MAG: alpha/beta hydrolase [Bdellovibrionales bacterium]|nr:alpha/beta hydrolase [Bdellovibrionales bacterium]
MKRALLILFFVCFGIKSIFAETLSSPDQKIEKSLMQILSLHCCSFKNVQVEVFKSDEIKFLSVEKKGEGYFQIKYGIELEKSFPVTNVSTLESVVTLVRVVEIVFNETLFGPLEKEKALSDILTFYQVDTNLARTAIEQVIREGQVNIQIYAINYLTTSAADPTSPLSPQGGARSASPAFNLDIANLPYYTVKVFYGTNRSLTYEADVNKHFGTKRSNGLKLGEVYVTIPKSHQHGNMERPKFWRFEIDEDPKKHITLKQIKEQTLEDFVASVTNSQQTTPENTAFVFIHGYNVSFASAARRAAQIFYDIKFKGTPFMFSWPSNGEVESYVSDSNDARNANDELQDFLKIILKQGYSKVHIIAHSMGNLVTGIGLKHLSENAEFQGAFKNIIMAAPDIDEEEFRKEVARALPKMADNVTIYSSSLDKAILVSSELNGYPRVGGLDNNGDSFVFDGITSINASGEDMSFFDQVGLNHSYYGESSMLKEIAKIIDYNSTPEQRGLERIQRGQRVYYKFRR